MPRRSFLARGAVAAGAVAAAPLFAAEQALAGRGELGLVGMDHVGLTVPGRSQAVDWFEDILGAVAPLSFGPFAGSFLEGALDVVPGTQIDEITMLRIGHSAGIELFEYESPGQRQDMPKNSDWSGHHVAFYVTDIDAAVEYMDSRGVEKVTRMFGPFTLTAGPAAGQSINYFRTPWNGYIEFISYPNGMAYQNVPSVKPLWSPKQNGLRSEVTKVPGLLGIDHIGITVPDIAIAAQWLERNLGYTNPLTFGPFSDTGDFMKQLVDVDPRAVVREIRMLRGGNGPGIELFDYTSPDQDRSFRRNSDWGGHHIALYVRHIDKAVDFLQSETGSKLDGPLTLTDGPAAGQSINYFRTPFGTNVELISYPHGMAYEKTARIPLWDPRDNHP
jgi:catechol 2,3-dioxygenase-like lactoylglutathione lyase family enzyme